MDGPSLSTAWWTRNRPAAVFQDSSTTSSVARGIQSAALTTQTRSPKFSDTTPQHVQLFKVRTTRTSVNFDFYNVLNSNSVINENITYGPTWRTPQLILLPRIFKLSAQFDF